MSDYGFATYDERTGKRVAKINSKYPVFGPKYADIKTAFRTTHISDTKTYSVRPNSVAIPTPNLPFYGVNNYYGVGTNKGYIEELVAEYEHGYDFRPLGYATVTGNITNNLVGQLQQTATSGGSSYGGNFTIYLNRQWFDVELRPSAGEILAQTNGDIAPWEYSAVAVGNMSSNAGFKVPNSVLGVFLTQYNPSATINLRDFGDIPPYRVEIDDKKVKIWKCVYWSEQVLRAKRPSFDIYHRKKLIENFAGTEIDVTVYLCPYKMEDLL